MLLTFNTEQCAINHEIFSPDTNNNNNIKIVRLKMHTFAGIFCKEQQQ